MTDQELRKKCLETIQAFFDLPFDQTSTLFTEDGAKEIPYSWVPGTLMRWEGKEKVHENFVANTGLFRVWTWEGLKIYSTQEPDVFWAETKGIGTQSTGGEETAYENHYVFCFKMRGDKILECREFNNPLSLMVSLGLDIPEMPNAVEHTHEVFEAMQS